MSLEVNKSYLTRKDKTDIYSQVAVEHYQNTLILLFQVKKHTTNSCTFCLKVVKVKTLDECNEQFHRQAMILNIARY